MDWLSFALGAVSLGVLLLLLSVVIVGVLIAVTPLTDEVKE